MLRTLLMVLTLFLLLMLTACGEQKSEPRAPEQKPEPKELRVVVPESVAGQWQSVKIALHDQQAGTENTYQVDIGGSFQIPETDYRVTVENFLPAFAVNSERATSVTNQATNPAVQIVVRDGQREVLRDWIFGLYPNRQQLIASRYKLVLLDYRAKK